MPAVRRLTGGPLLAGATSGQGDVLLAELDARLGVPGVPQSATGQTTLFTGINAAAQLGFHLPAYPNAKLTDLLHQGNVLRRAVGAGYRATFANAYSQAYFDRVQREGRRMSATTHSVLGAGIPFRWLSDLERGEAVYWDITGEHVRGAHGVDTPIVTPEEAGANLARISRNNDLVLFECFLPDLIGHRKDFGGCPQLSGFVGSVPRQRLALGLARRDHAGVQRPREPRGSDPGHSYDESRAPLGEGAGRRRICRRRARWSTLSSRCCLSLATARRRDALRAIRVGAKRRLRAF